MTSQFQRTSRLTLATLLLCGGVSALAGCETWRGLGKDVSSVGESMQKDGESDDSSSDDAVESED